MAYSPLQISSALLKSEKTIYKIGQIAYDNMFSEDDETLDYERDIIFIYKESVNYAKNVYIGEQKLDKLVEKLSAKIYAYDYGELNPVYSDAVITASAIVGTAYLNDLSDVTISNLLDNQILRYNAATGQWINVGPGNTVRNSQSFVATAGQTSFTTAYPFDIQLLDVYINGVKINSSSYSTVGEYTINLVDGCIAGDIVDVVIFDPETSILPPVNNLNDLNDVNIGPLVNKQGLYYNSVSGLWENGLVFVPYTGALGNVDLGEYEIRAGQFTLDTSPTGVATVGTTRWNDTIGSSETTLKGGSVILKNGVDLVARIVNKVSPNQTLTKAAYQAVRVSGAQGQRLAVALAQANNDNNSADTIGLVTETIATNQEGFIMTVGSLEGINTTGSLQGETWVDGDVIYLSPTTAGALTNVKPIAPQHIIVIGYVEYAHANNGKLYVKVMNGWELGELHDVDTTGATAGQVLKYNGTIWTPSGDAGITGTGTSGQVAYFTGSTTQAGSNNLFWDNANVRLGIGRNNPQNSLHISSTGGGAIYLEDSDATSTFNTTEISNNAGNFNLTTRSSAGAFVSSDYQIVKDTISSQYHRWFTGGTERVRLFNTGNFGIGTGATDSGQRLQVIGTSSISGQADFGNAILVAGPIGAHQTSKGVIEYNANKVAIRAYGATAGTGIIAFNTGGGGGSADTERVRIMENGSVLVGIAGITNVDLMLRRNLTATSGTAYSVYVNSTIQSDVTSNASLFATNVSTQAAAFTLTNLFHYNASPTTIGAGSAITNEYGFYGNLSAATGRWNLYMNGTANNYMAGSLGVGSTSLSIYNLRISKNITGSYPFAVWQDGTVQSTASNIVVGIQNSLRTQAASFTIPEYNHFSVEQYTLGAGSSVTTQTGFNVDNTVTGATNNYAFRGQIAAATGRWNIFMNGTALNYLNGSLLIGSTTDSGEKLQVTGTAKITGATTFASTVVITSNAPFYTGGNIYTTSSNLGIGTTTANVLGFFTNNSERMRLDASGNLGLGVTNPSEKIQVSGNILLVSGYNLYGNATSGNYSKIELYNSSTGNMTLATYFATASMLFLTNGTERMRLDANGNLGLGVTPSQTLHVGTTNANVTNYAAIGDSTNQRLLVGYAHASGVTNNVISAQVLSDSSGNLLLSSRTNSASDIILYTNSATTATERLRIKTNGQVRYIPLASAPSGAEAGDVYYNSTDNKHYGYNGTTWNAFY